MQTHYQLLTKHSLLTWNLMIQASVRNGSFAESLHLYSSMIDSGVHGNNFTFPLIAKACAKLGSIRDGRKLHAHAILIGFEGDVYVKTSLVDMYSKCSHLEESRQLFDEMPNRSLVSWNSMISAYSKEIQINRSFELLKDMRVIGLKPNSSTCVSLVSGCTGVASSLWHGLSIQCYVIKLGFDSDLCLSNSIINMYVRFNLLNSAHSLFDSMEEKSTVTCTTIIGGYVRVGDYASVFNLFNEMRREQVESDSITFINLTSACALLGSLSISCSIHALLIKNGFDQDSIIANSLVNSYIKCSDLASAQKFFDLMQEKNVIMWTSLIGGYVHGGYTGEALALFQKLLTTTIKPNEVTLATILSACADFGSLSIGEMVEAYVVDNGLGSDLRVQTSLIHMYCRSGSIERAKKIFDGVSPKDSTVWSTMINGYASHGKGEQALALFKEMQREEDIKLDAIAFTDVLTACSHSGLVEEGLKCFNSMQKDYGIEPNIEHYFCLVDLLCRAGHFDYALKIIDQILPIEVRNQVWLMLLSACRAHDNTQLGELVSQHLFNLEPQSTGNYILMANIHASLGRWEEATWLRRLMDKRGLIKEPGWSRIEFNS